MVGTSQIWRFRRSGAATLATVVLATAVAVVGPAGAAEEFVAGSGQVEARLVRVGPSAGRLSFAPSVGLVLADYVGTVGRGESRLLDYAALDGEIPPELKAHAPDVRAESTGDEGEDGAARRHPGTPPGSPIQAGVTTQRARAGDEPFGAASIVVGDLPIVPGAVEVAGGRAATRSGVVDGAVRESRGVVDIARLELGGGAVVLEGLRWTVHHRTGDIEEIGGEFSASGVTIDGERTAIPGGNLEPAMGPINQALAPAGLRLGLPRDDSGNGVARIAPLRIRIADADAASQVVPPAVEGAHAVREPVADALLEHAPDAASLLLLADIGLGVLAGSGRLDVELGGAVAFTEGVRYENPFETFDLGGTPRPAVPASGGGGAAVRPPTPLAATPAPGLLEGGGSQAAPAVESPHPGRAALVSSREPGTRGGPAAVVGLLGLLTAAVLAGADWHRMRTAARRLEVPA